jgi:integrase
MLTVLSTLSGAKRMSKLTQKTIDNREHPATGYVLVRDDEICGFGLCIYPRTKSYFVERRVNGRMSRVTIGRADLLTLEEARKKARQMLGSMAAGVDPNAIKRNQRAAALTLTELLEAYLIAKASLLRPSTISVYRRQINHAFKRWLNMPVQSISRDMVEDRHREMANGTCKGGNSGRAYANGAFTTLQALLNFAMEKYEIDGEPIISVNPVSRLTKTRAWYRVHPRTGVVPETKMRDWYLAVQALDRQYADYFTLLLLTGIRRQEGLTLKWEDVDFNEKTLIIRRTHAKNNRDHVLPLSQFLVDLLRRRYDTRPANEYVFPGRGNKSHLTCFRPHLLQVRKQCGCNFMAHDLRRSFLTAAERLELPYYVLKKLANHTITPDSLTPYIVVSQERLREHMEKITRHFLTLMEVEHLASPPTHESRDTQHATTAIRR